MTQTLRRLVSDEDGQDLIEYALLVALVAVGSLGILQLVTDGTTNIFTSVLAALGGA